MDEETDGIETYFTVQMEAAYPPGKWVSMRQTVPTIELARDWLLMTCRKEFPDKRLRIIKITEEPVLIDDPEA